MKSPSSPSSRVWYGVGLFLVVTALFQVRPNTNPLSRFALLCSMIEESTFRIDSYRDMTIDWSKTPDGHYFSNKAPGPALAAFPLYWMFNRVVSPRPGMPLSHEIAARAKRDGDHWEWMRPALQFLSFMLQILPFAIAVGFGIVLLQELGVTAAAVHFFVAAALFGNTASLFMNSFFGHGMAAACVLGLALALLRRSDKWAGFLFGWALLSDYGAALLLPGVLYYLWSSSEKGTSPKRLARFVVGGALPGVLWIWYHASCFGGPLTLPQAFQNPAFADATGKVIGFLPSPYALFELLFGMSRGLLWTQPWVLVLATAFPFAVPGGETRRYGIFALSGLALLLWMNAAFGTWEGGDSPGPRYLSLVFPAVALLAGLSYDRLSRGFRLTMWGGLTVSVALFLLFFAAPIMPHPGIPLWPLYLTLTFGNPPVPDVIAYVASHALVRFVMLLPLFGWTAWGILRKTRRVTTA